MLALFLCSVVSFSTPPASQAIAANDGRSLRASPRLVVQLGHRDDIASGAFSPDGRLALTGGRDGYGLIWSLADGLELLRVDHGRKGVDDARFSSDGTLFLTGDADGRYVVWRTATGAKVAEIDNPAGGDDAQAFTEFSADLRFALASDRNNLVRLTELATGRVLFEHAFAPDRVTRIHLSGDNRAIVETAQLQPYVWDGALRRIEVRSLSYGFSQGGRYIALGVESPTEQARRLKNASEQTRAYVLENPSPDTLVLVDSHSFAEVMRASNAFGVAISPDERIAVTDSIDDRNPEPGFSALIVRDVASGRELGRLHLAKADAEDSFRISFSADGRTVRGVSDKVCVWDAATGALLHRAELQPLATGRVTTVVFSPDGATVLIGQQRGMQQNPIREALLVDVATGKVTGRLAGFAEPLRLVDVSEDNVRVPVFTDSGDAFVWNTETGGVERTLRWRKRADAESEQFNEESYANVAVGCSADGSMLVFGNDRFGSSPIGAFDLAHGGKGARFAPTLFDGAIHAIAVDADGRRAALVSADSSTMWLVDLETKRIVARDAYPGGRPAAMRVAPDGRSATIVMPDGVRGVLDAARGRFSQLGDLDEPASAAALSPDGGTLALGYADGRVRLFDFATGKDLGAFTGGAASARSVSVLDGGAAVASADAAGAVRLWRRGGASPVWKYSDPTWANDEIFDLIVELSPDGRHVSVLHENHEVAVFDAETGNVGLRVADYDIRFLRDGHHAVTETIDGSLRLANLDDGVELCRLVALPDGTWIVVAPDGRFDTNNLEDAKGLHWVVPDAAYTALPVEIFSREYYEPRLMARLLAGERFAPVRDLTQLDRRQPSVRIASVDADRGTAGTVTVRVDVERPGGSHPAPGRVFDLKLFRDGQLVGLAPDGGGELRFDEATGKASVVFEAVRLPRRADARSVEFSAYAFNADQVKSATDRKTYTRSGPVSAVKGRAYVVSVGVNAYEDPRLNLRYAANDARRIQSVVVQKLTASAKYADVVGVSLVSDYTKTGDAVETTTRDATKASIQAVADLLAGRTVDPSVVAAIPGASRIKAARPEDLVLLSFSGHGYSDARGTFYLVPYDTGGGVAETIKLSASAAASTASDALPDDLLARFVSSDELSDWLRDVDAGDFVLVVDACQSAASVAQRGFKPGPMGSRGLGQLAYDKGMRILAATQADNVAIETRQLRHGLLTYALVREGIEARRADVEPKDRLLTALEWLEYGLERVPTLYEEVKIGRVQQFGPATDKALVLVEGSGGASSRKIQRPALFDFSRGRRNPVIGALP